MGHSMSLGDFGSDFGNGLLDDFALLCVQFGAERDRTQWWESFLVFAGVDGGKRRFQLGLLVAGDGLQRGPDFGRVNVWI